MGWADEAEEAVNEALAADGGVFDPSLEDVGMDLNAEALAATAAAEGGGGGLPASRFGPTVARTTDYNNPISQRFAMNSSAEINAIVEAVKVGVQQAIGSSPLAQQYGAIYNAAGADFPQNPGFGTGTELGSNWDVLQNAAGEFVKVDNYGSSFPYASQNYSDFGTAGLNVLGQGNVSRALQGQGGWGTKINDIVQALNPFRIDAIQDWAYPQTITKTSPGTFPNQATVGEYADAVAWAKRNFPDQDIQSVTQPSGIFEETATGPLTQAQQNLALIEQATLDEGWLSEHMAQPHLTQTLDLIGSQRLLAQQTFDDDTVGYPNQMGIYGPGTPVQEDLGSGYWESDDPTRTLYRGWEDVGMQPSIDELSPGEQQRHLAAIMKELTTPTILEGATDTYGDELPEYNIFASDDGTLAGMQEGTFSPETVIDELPLSKNKMDEEFWSRPLPCVDARTVTGDAQRDLARQWEKTVSDEWTEMPALDIPPLELEKEKVKTVTKSKYGTWDGKFNKKTPKQNLEAQKTFRQALIDDFEKRWGSPSEYAPVISSTLPCPVVIS